MPHVGWRCQAAEAPGTRYPDCRVPSRKMLRRSTTNLVPMGLTAGEIVQTANAGMTLPRVVAVAGVSSCCARGAVPRGCTCVAPAALCCAVVSEQSVRNCVVEYQFRYRSQSELHIMKW